MPTHITLLRYTQRGIEAIKHRRDWKPRSNRPEPSAGNSKRSRHGSVRRGGDLRVAGRRGRAKVPLATGSRGFVRTETLRAFTEEEYRKLIAGLP
jgi:uncharacterized protein with GYD domain